MVSYTTVAINKMVCLLSNIATLFVDRATVCDLSLDRQLLLGEVLLTRLQYDKK